MKNNSKTLFIEIGKNEIFFFVGETINENFRIIYKNSVQVVGISKNKITDIEKFSYLMKTNLILIEDKLNFIFKEIILIINNFDCHTINLSGYKKLNGSQLAKDNITYILNSLKSKISEVENNKKILHIFSTKYSLDNKELENIPIGLFGDFYSQELSFFLMCNNDYKNLKNVFDNCNLNIKKIISKNFIEGVKLINENTEFTSFLLIKIEKKESQLILFENSSFKFIQNFNFGTDIILDDIYKITSLDKYLIRKILQIPDYFKISEENEIIGEEFFVNQNFRKIKKKLIVDISSARIQELAEIIMINNINISEFLKTKKSIFLQIDDHITHEFLLSKFELFFSKNKKFKVNFLNIFRTSELCEDAKKIVQFGWKNEAIPVVERKQSLISRFFNLIFK